MVQVNGLVIDENLPQSIRDDEPDSRFSDEAKLIMIRKYLIKDTQLQPVETIKERIIRIAQTMAEPERQYGGDEAYKHWLENFYHMIAQRDFSPGGRIWSNAGTSIPQLFNCFVFPQFENVPGIMKTLIDTALTHKEGGGTGFNFSVVPPKGIQYDGMISPGAVITIDNTDVETETICQGNRRGANMGVLDYNYPDILDFIYAKRDRREVRDRAALEIMISNFVWDIFNAMQLGYDPTRFQEEISHLLDSSLMVRRYARKIDVAVSEPQDLEDRLTADGLFPVMDPLTGQPLTRDNLMTYAGNVQRNKAALGADAVFPLSVTEANNVINEVTGKEVGQVKDGQVYLDYSKVRQELETSGVSVRKGVDSIEIKDDLREIFGYISRAAASHIAGENTALDFSHLRAKGSPVRGGAAISSGVRSFVRNYDTEAGMYLQNGNVGESTAVISVDHPDLFDVASLMTTYWDMNRPKAFVESIAGYVREKVKSKYGDEVLPKLEGLESAIVKVIRSMPKHQVREAHKLKNFNISVLVDEGFVEALKQDTFYPLMYNGRQFTREDLESAIINTERAKAWLGQDAEHSLRLEGDKVFETYSGKEIGKVEDGVVKLHATTIFDLIVENAHATADPGLLFGFNANKNGQLKGEIYIATNPCGEIWLYWYEPCNLGSVNLKKMIRHNGRAELDEEKLYSTTYMAQRFLDNVHDANHGPIPEVELASRRNRRTGLGLMGWANFLADLWIPYDSEEALELAERVGRIMQDASFNASLDLAKEKGPFPSFDISTYDPSKPRRNIASLAIAPTGTISMAFDVNSAIEPFFAIVYKKMMRGGDFIPYAIREFEDVSKQWGFYNEKLLEDITVNRGSVQGMNNIPEEVRRVFRTSRDISPEWHVRTQAVFQRYMDNAVSKTINLPNSATPKDVKDAYLLAMHSGLKGITVYRDGSRDEQILVS